MPEDSDSLAVKVWDTPPGKGRQQLRTGEYGMDSKRKPQVSTIAFDQLQKQNHRFSLCLLQAWVYLHMLTIFFSLLPIIIL